MSSPIFDPGRIGGLELKNRVIRAGTSETMATADGAITDDLVALYERLAEGMVGLIFTGHLYCYPRGRYAPRQTGIWSDELLPGLNRLTAAVHRHGGRIFAQVAHAGSQSRVADNEPLAPSPVPNALTGRMVGEATEAEIWAAIEAFAAGARRAVTSGFDGIHIHAGHGYLISEFSSPLTNLRSDEWGGSPERRNRFVLEVVRAIREVVPTELPVSVKLGMYDAVPNGLEIEEALARAKLLVGAGVSAIEVSTNVMGSTSDSVRQYVGVQRGQAIKDLLLHRALAHPVDEAYHRNLAKRLRPQIDVPIVLVGGIRRVETMEEVLRSGDADFVSLARPFIREPDLVAKIASGRRGPVACTSCNLCVMHEAHHSLRCWRTPRRRLLEHLVYRLRGGFRVSYRPRH